MPRPARTKRWGNAPVSCAGAAAAFGVACAAGPSSLPSGSPLPGSGLPAPSAEEATSPPAGSVVALDPAGPASAAPGTSSSAAPASPSGPACDPSAVRLPLEETPRAFGFGGYLRRGLPVAVEGGAHCVEVLYPDGDSSWGKVPCSASAHLDEGWLRLVANTLARLPRAHALLLRRIVIDNRPKEHGIAPYNRKDASDARDGHTIWLHERLFEDVNHWAQGNHGRYWSYHTNVDGKAAEGAGGAHTLFSPVLLHEIAHLVSYSLSSAEQDKEIVPACAAICGGGSCKRLSSAQREKGCLSPYCMPFKNDVGTENFAEQYRLHFQSSVTRELLANTPGSCSSLLTEIEKGLAHEAPWRGGLPDIGTFRKSVWKSCGERACKPY